MQISIILELEEFIDNTNNELLRLFNKFTDCRRQLEMDYEAGLLSDAEYRYISGLCIYTYDEHVNPEYMLSKEEALFVSTYGDVGVTGELMADLIKPKYTKKHQLLMKIVDSVRILYFFNNIEEEKRKETFINIISTYYDKEINSKTLEMERLKAKLGPNYYASLGYQKVANEVKELESAKKIYIERCEKCTSEEFIKLLIEYYDIDLDYYNWYKKRFIKEKCETELATRDQVKEIKMLEKSTHELIDEQKIVGELQEKLRNTFASMHEFTIAAASSEDVITLQENQLCKGLGKVFKKKNSNNKLELLEIFRSFIYINGFMSFLEQFRKNDQELAADFNEMFEDYFKMVYGDSVEYVDPILFKRRLIFEVLNYYNRLIADISASINEKSAKVDETSADIENKALALSRFEDLKIYYGKEKGNFGRIDEILKRQGLTVDEIERLYNEIKAYIGDNLSKEYLEGPNLNLKVGS